MSQFAEQDDEIDLGELFAAVWYNWKIVSLAIAVSLLLAFYYVFEIAVPEYQASTRFELLDSSDSDPNLSQAASLAALAGISIPGSSSEADTLHDRILARPFIDSIFDKADFKSDPTFNVTLQDLSPVTQTLEFFLGFKEEKKLERNDYLVMTIEELRERLFVAPKDNGIIELTVIHPDGERAAQIANIIVEQTLLDIFERERSLTRDGLNYFADELLRVRADLDASNAAVRDYAITNNLQSAEELARTSAQLAQVRREIEEIEESISAIGALRLEPFSGHEFAQSHPVSTSLSFRRLLNLGGDPNDWQIPADDELMRAEERLIAQKSQLISTFNALEERAKNSGAEALELAALRREVEVQQAIYESVITQFEARSLVSGFERASGRILETAIAPDEPSSPQEGLIIVLAIVLGIFAGIAVALIVSMRLGRLYSVRAVRESFALPGAQPLAASALAKIGPSELTPKQLISAQDLLVFLNENDKIFPVASTFSELLSARLALGLSKAASKIGGKSAILDLSGQSFKTLNLGRDSTVENGVRKLEGFGKVDLLEAVETNSFLNAATCNEQLEGLCSIYERVFIVLPTPDKGTAISRRVSQSMDQLIILARLGKTTRSEADAIKLLYADPEVSDPLLVII